MTAGSSSKRRSWRAIRGWQWGAAGIVLVGCNGPKIPDQTAREGTGSGGASGGAGSQSAVGGASAGTPGAANGGGGVAGAGSNPGQAGGGLGGQTVAGNGGASAGNAGAMTSSGGNGGNAGETCGDTRYDPANCGECGHSCDPDVACTRGVCGRQIGTGSTRYFALVTLPIARTYGWGVNGDGGLGCGKYSDWTPLLWSAEIPQLRSTGGRCGIDRMGNVLCWGTNDSGEIGNGTVGGPDEDPLLADLSHPGAYSVPQHVSLPKKAIDISFGGYWDTGNHVCALLEDRTVSCWGYNPAGLVDPSSTDNALVPVAQSLARPVLQVGAAREVTCALLDNGDLSCWGNLAGLALDPSVPTVIASDIVGFDIGYRKLVAIDKMGNVLCVGNGPVCGTGTMTIQPLAQVPGLPDRARYVVSPESATCALLENGELWCWGGNTSFRGLGCSDSTCASASMVFAPSKVPLADVVEISATLGALVARTSDGTVWTLGASWDPNLDECVCTPTKRKAPPGLLGDETAGSFLLACPKRKPPANAHHHLGIELVER